MLLFNTILYVNFFNIGNTKYTFYIKHFFSKCKNYHITSKVFYLKWYNITNIFLYI